MKCPYVSETDSYSNCDQYDVDGGCDTCHIAASAGQEAPNYCDDQTLIKLLLGSADEAEKDDPFLTNLLEHAADRIREASEKEKNIPDPFKARYTLSLTAEEIVTFRENLIFVNQFCDVPRHMSDQLQRLIVYFENLMTDRR